MYRLHRRHPTQPIPATHCADDDAPLPDDTNTNTNTDTDTDQDGSPDAVDCAPNDPAIHPGAEESCNGLDDDCDGSIDEEARRWYRDGDGDGHGDATGAAVWGACDVPPPGHVDDSTDCDDTNPDINPSATEVCDPLDVDEDCDGRSDDDDDSATGKLDYFEDGDGDGYGSEQAEPEAWCDPPPDRVRDATDCDDEDATTHPGASEAEIGLLEDAACEGVAGGNLTRADFIFVGEQDGDTLGTSLRSAGDVDGDGLDDILIGARNNDDVDHGAGTTYLILGSTLVTASSSPFDLMDSDYIFLGEHRGDWSGSAVSSAGDVDGDGLDDILVGAMGNDDNGDASGKAYLVMGSSLAASPSSSIELADADFSFIGEAALDRLGYDLSSAGDVDDDGLDDIILGAPWNNDNGYDAGKRLPLPRTHARREHALHPPPLRC